MIQPQPEHRSANRRVLDARIADEPPLSPPEIGSASPMPLEAHLARLFQRPRAIVGRVENGVVVPVDPAVKLTEQARVIIVTSEEL